MKVRDIRSSKDWQDTGEDFKKDTSWTSSLIGSGEPAPVDERRRMFIPLQLGDGKGIAVPRPDGSAAGIPGEVVEHHDETDIQWNAKQAQQPCLVCKHFIVNTFTNEEKVQLMMLLIKEHGWTPDLVKADIADVRPYHYCRVYELLTHQHATCPRYFVKRDDI